MQPIRRRSVPLAVLLACTASFAQSPPTAQTRTFHDSAYRISFAFPANWTFAEADRQISTFHLDARTAPRDAKLRAIIAMPENPFPASTFSGAYVYFSVKPHTSAAACAHQATPPRPTRAEAARRSADSARSTSESDPAPSLALAPGKIQIAGIPFTHGHDQQRDICIVQRDEVYTTRHAGACYRFDLAINNFCGGEVSGVKNITPQELDQVRARLLAILSTARFDSK